MPSTWPPQAKQPARPPEFSTFSSGLIFASTGGAGGGAIKVPLEEAAVVPDEKAAEMIALDDALKTLAEFDPRRAQVIELKYFGGLSNEEIGAVLQVHPNTVMRDWNMARAWLYKELSGAESEAQADEP